MKVRVPRCIAVLFFAFLCYWMTGCGGGASATTTPPPPPPSGGVFTFSSASLDFGSVNVGSNKALTISMSNKGGSSLTVTQFSMNSTAFSISGVTLPLTLNAGQTTTGTITFTPSAAGAANATVNAIINSSSAASLGLTGTGTTTPPPPGNHSVSLSWLASTSPNIVAYNVYRATVSTGPFTRVGNVAGTTFTDSNVQTGSYFYEVTAVDNTNTESAPTAAVSASVP